MKYIFFYFLLSLSLTSSNFLRSQNLVYKEPSLTIFSKLKIEQKKYNSNNPSGYFYLINAKGEEISILNSRFPALIDSTNNTYNLLSGININKTLSKRIYINYCSSNRITLSELTTDYLSLSKDTIVNADIFSSNINSLLITKCHFIGDFYCLNNNFKLISLIDSSIFNNEIFFENDTIHSLNYYDNEFKNGISFYSSEISEESEIQNCIFNSSSAFSDLLIKGNLNFNNCVLKSKILLKNIKLDTADIIFNETILPDTIIISDNNNLNGKIVFTSANFSDPFHLDLQKRNYIRKHALYLSNTDVSKIKLDYKFFKLIFQSSSSDIELPSTEKEAIYEQLLSNFKENGQYESYELLDIEYKRFKSKMGDLSFLWWFPEYWDNYGYNKEYIFIWTLGLLIGFSLLNFLAYNCLLKVYRISSMPTYQRKYNLSRLWFAFVLTSIIFFSLSLKIDKIDFKNKGGTLYIIIIYTIGLICLAYMANFVIQK